ncbi:MAG TPA: SRPBCC family protein [Gemmatimonadales bacterium]|nr:SRPBCC family protein [Gemmatimonadales bacterium]
MTAVIEESRPYGRSAAQGFSEVDRYQGYETHSRRFTDQQPKSSEDSAKRRARGLGWFSIGLGLAQIGAPRSVARLIGIRDDDETRNTMFAIGLREIASGLGILSSSRPTGWVWSRVGGDIMDLELLRRSMNDCNDKSRVAAATAAVAGVTVVDILTGQQLSKQGNGTERRTDGAAGFRSSQAGGVHVSEHITIKRPRNEVYGFWHNFENLPRFMAHLESVQVLDNNRSRWKAKAPAGMSVEWEAETLEDRANELISWRSLPDAEVPNSGTVQFKDAPGSQGTEVHVELRYQPPGGKLGALVAKLFGEEPEQQVKGDLRRFKQVMETGEIVHSDASIHKGMHPARPPQDLSDVEMIGSPSPARA